jgi:hypothetical protein
MRLLFGIESAALAHAADGRVLGPLNLAYYPQPQGQKSGVVAKAVLASIVLEKVCLELHVGIQYIISEE